MARARHRPRRPYREQGVGIDELPNAQTSENGLQYAIRLGDARSAPIRGVGVDYLHEAPIATFTFRYRSLDTLCEKGRLALQEACCGEVPS
ncbi:hypothetical protein K523DRAFT_139655 [Schizophyllum commune Tattone D]|nr:hypothetical protein K523DRAFT_139655 [Schizophyllum commune Tattone D]